MPPRVVILGGGYAGATAASRLRSALRAGDLRVTLLDASLRFTERIRLHQLAAGQAISDTPMSRLVPRQVELRRATVLAVDPAGRRVTIGTDGRRESLGYDYLIWALGSRIDTSEVPGVAEHTLSLSSRSAAERAAASLAGVHRVAIVGGGLTGIELATELAESHPGLEVSLVSRTPPGADLGTAARRHLVGAFSRLGVAVLERSVERVEADRLLLAGGGELAFDRCFWNAGFVASPLAAEAGLPVDGLGRLPVLPSLQVPDRPEIFGAGDAAAVQGPDGRPLRMACATGQPMGAHAADQVMRRVGGREPEPFRYGFLIRCVSLGRRDGLVQPVDAADRPREGALTGRPASWVKERVCRLAKAAIRWEARSPWPVVTWRRVESRPTPSDRRAIRSRA